MSSSLDGITLKKMVIGAATVLEQNKDALDAMNVFPVPDGDTGTNMSLTMVTAAQEVAAIPDEELTIKRVAEELSQGALKGARGNSGVILSQLFAGFADAITSWEGEPGTKMMALAFERGVEYAYKAVMKPKEGTILTVARSVSDAANLFAERSDDVRKQIDYCMLKGEETLKETPEMLPVLKEAGVVDAGGAGYLAMLMGFRAVINGEAVDLEGILESTEPITDFTDLPVHDEDIEFGYCTEFFVKNMFPDTKPRDIDTYRNNLSKIGDSILVVGDINLVKTHVHTNEPGLALQYAQILGELSQIKIDNMREQHRELSDVYEDVLEAEDLKHKPLAVVAVSTGEGIRAIFSDWQVDGFVEGGQSMNPSTQDILEVVDNLNADHVIVLPNNKNIVLAAEQAAELSKNDVTVINTTSIPQGIAAALSYDPDGTWQDNMDRMNSAIEIVKTGQITYAMRDTKLNGTTIKKDDIIGIAEGDIVSNGDSLDVVALEMMQKLIGKYSEIITIYYGEDTEESSAEKLQILFQKEYSNMDVELMYGGQPVYQYLISVE